MATQWQQLNNLLHTHEIIWADVGYGTSCTQTTWTVAIQNIGLSLQ